MGAPQKSASPGFTLLEMIVVMALLTLIMALAAPRLGGFMTGRDVSNEGRRFIALTHYARSQAIAHSERMDVWINPELGQYGLRPESPSSQEDERPVQFQAASMLKVEGDEELFDTQEEIVILFWPDGSIDESSPVRLKLTENSEVRRIITLNENRSGYTIEEPRDVRR